MPGQPKLRRVCAEIEKLGGDEHVLDRVAAGETICSIAKGLHASRGLLYRWLHACEDRERAWADAKRQSADALVDQGLEILDSPSDNVTSAEVQLRKGRSDYRRWLASVRDRQQYGENNPAVSVNLDFAQMHMQALLAAGSYASLKRPEPERLEAEIEGAEEG